MATTTPPPTPTPSQPPEPPRAPVRARRRSPGRGLALGALAIVIALVAYLVFGREGGATYHLIFGEAGQLVRGDQVQVGGVPVGSVKEISLTREDKADVTIHVEGSLAPLHAGTRAQRVAARKNEREIPRRADIAREHL